MEMSFRLPSDCKKDEICKWLKDKLGASTELKITGYYGESLYL